MFRAESLLRLICFLCQKLHFWENRFLGGANARTPYNPRAFLSWAAELASLRHAAAQSSFLRRRDVLLQSDMGGHVSPPSWAKRWPPFAALVLCILLGLYFGTLSGCSFVSDTSFCGSILLRVSQDFYVPTG